MALIMYCCPVPDDSITFTNRQMPYHAVTSNYGVRPQDNVVSYNSIMADITAFLYNNPMA
uniref:Uncharacterized protein n=1 Tax=viral metagenome TaxID=1070528 RepID=A0A6H1Z8G3_9ZZZZ